MPLNFSGHKHMQTLNLPQDFNEFLNLLHEHNVKFLVIGGYAVAFHGHPRFTGDLDIWIEISEENAQRVVSSIKAFGFDVPKLKPESFLKENYIACMGEEPMRIEIFTSIPGVRFSTCWDNRCYLKQAPAKIPFISLEDLKASGRHQDLADIEKLP
jgi:hypothetical protein